MRRAQLLLLLLIACLPPAGCRRSVSPVGAAKPAPARSLLTSRNNPLQVNGAKLNGVQRNGRAINGCNNEGLPFSDIQENPLNSSSLQAVPAIFDSLCDEASRGVLSYIVECALNPEDTLEVTLDDGSKHSFTGDMGLAPQWKNAPCDQDCQEWVTSCFTARGNFYGVHVEISMRAEKGPPILHTDAAERAKFPVQEGAFYGNMFAFPSVAYACRGRGHDPYYQAVRRCAQVRGDCGFIKPFGTCDFYDGVTDEPAGTRSCEAVTDEGAFINCHSKFTNASQKFDPPGVTYKFPITIFTKHADFTPDGC